MILGVPKFITGISVPINEQPAFTIQYCVSDPNAPMNYFICLTLYNSSDGAQIGVASDNYLYCRFKGDGVWYDWNKVAQV